MAKRILVLAMASRPHTTTNADQRACCKSTRTMGPTTLGRPDAAVAAHCLKVRRVVTDNATVDGTLKAEGMVAVARYV